MTHADRIRKRDDALAFAAGAAVSLLTTVSLAVLYSGVTEGRGR